MYNIHISESNNNIGHGNIFFCHYVCFVFRERIHNLTATYHCICNLGIMTAKSCFIVTLGLFCSLMSNCEVCTSVLCFIIIYLRVNGVPCHHGPYMDSRLPLNAPNN
jgi:hypothetical protein